VHIATLDTPHHARSGFLFDQVLHHAGKRPVRREWGTAILIWFRRPTTELERLRRVSVTWATISVARSRNSSPSGVRRVGNEVRSNQRGAQPQLQPLDPAAKGRL